MKRLLSAMLVLVAAGCASVPLADPSADAAAKRFVPPPEKSAIYLFRDETIASANTIPVALDGKIMGETAPLTYFLWIVEPGEHRVTSHTSNPSTVNLYTEPGRNYFIWQEIKIELLKPGTQLWIVDDKRGRQGVKGGKRAETLAQRRPPA